MSRRKNALTETYFRIFLECQKSDISTAEMYEMRNGIPIISGRYEQRKERIRHLLAISKIAKNDKLEQLCTHWISISEGGDYSNVKTGNVK